MLPSLPLTILLNGLSHFEFSLATPILLFSLIETLECKLLCVLFDVAKVKHLALLIVLQ